MLIFNLSHRSILCSTETSQRDSTQSFPDLLPLHRTLPAKRQAFSPPCIGICHFFSRAMAKVKSMPHCLVQQSRFVLCPKMQAPQTPWFSKGIFLGAFTQLVCKTQLQCHAHTVIYKWIHMLPNSPARPSPLKVLETYSCLSQIRYFSHCMYISNCMYIIYPNRNGDRYLCVCHYH